MNWIQEMTQNKEWKDEYLNWTVSAVDRGYNCATINLLGPLKFREDRLVPGGRWSQDEVSFDVGETENVWFKVGSSLMETIKLCKGDERVFVWDHERVG
jgi:hypothetical protein